jgi:hypothetical protein
MPKAEKYLIDYAKHLYSQAVEESDENNDIIKKGEDYIDNNLV